MKKYTKYNLENNVLENYSDDFNQECFSMEEMEIERDFQILPKLKNVHKYEHSLMILNEWNWILPTNSNHHII